MSTGIFLIYKENESNAFEALRYIFTVNMVGYSETRTRYGLLRLLDAPGVQGHMGVRKGVTESSHLTFAFWHCRIH